MTSPDAAKAPANPVGLRLGDFVGDLLLLPEAVTGGERALVLLLPPSALSFSLLTEPLRHGRRFFEPVPIELIEPTSELSFAERNVELERVAGIVALGLRDGGFGGANSLKLWECSPVGDSTIVPSFSPGCDGVPMVGGDVAERS